MKENDIKFIFAKYVSLNIMGMIGLSCYILADTFFVARGVGADGLTSLNLAIPIYSFINGMGLMIGMGGATRFTISKSNRIFTQGIYYGLFAAILFLTMGIFFSKQLAILLGADKVTLYNTAIYLKVILCFAPMFLLNNIILCFVRNDNNPKLSMMAMLLGSFSNIILDYIFVFPLKMNMFGAALATGIAPIISLIILSTHFIKKRNSFRLLREKLEIKSIVDISSLGAPSLITEVSSGIVMIIFNIIILKISGNMAVAAYGIIANIALVVISIFTGISQGMQPILSDCYGMKNNENLKTVLKYGFITATVIAIFVYGTTIIFDDPIIAAFNKDGNLYLASVAKDGLHIYFIGFLFVGINILSATYFASTDNPTKAFIISFCKGFAVIIPMVFILSALFGIKGVWMSMPCAELFVLLICINMLKNINK